MVSNTSTLIVISAQARGRWGPSINYVTQAWQLLDSLFTTYLRIPPYQSNVWTNTLPSTLPSSPLPQQRVINKWPFSKVEFDTTQYLSN